MMQPHEACPNDGVCVDLELERRHNNRKGDWVKVLVAVASPVLAGLIGWTLIDQRNLEHRMTKVEERVESMKEDLKEIKADVKIVVSSVRK